MSVSLKDIAEYTGVSIKTVSNVVNGKYARVSPQTRKQIEEAIEKLNYRPNVAARHLRKVRTGVLALALPDLVNPYFADISSAIINVAAEHHYTVLIDYTKGERANELLILKGLRPQIIDGMILDAQSLDPDDIQPGQSNIPLVLLGERLFGAPYDHVVINNPAAARVATEHLIEIGRQRIAAIGVREHSQCEAPSLRLEGYLQALAAAGRVVQPALLARGGAWHREDGVLAMRYLLSLPEPPDAVFCFNDLLALGALSVLHEEGYRVPEDIALAGIDDIEDGRYSFPTLTTVAPDKGRISRTAVELLLGRIQGTHLQAPGLFDMPFQLHIRQSTIGRTL